MVRRAQRVGSRLLYLHCQHRAEHGRGHHRRDAAPVILAIGLAVGVNDLPTLRRAVRHFSVMTIVALLIHALLPRDPIVRVQSSCWRARAPRSGCGHRALRGRRGHRGRVPARSRERHSGGRDRDGAHAAALHGRSRNANWPFFFGALYLFALNCIFIAMATVTSCVTCTPIRGVHRRGGAPAGSTAYPVFVVLPHTQRVLMVGVVRESLFRRRASDFSAEPGYAPGCRHHQPAHRLRRHALDDCSSPVAASPRWCEQLEARMATAG